MLKAPKWMGRLLPQLALVENTECDVCVVYTTFKQSISETNSIIKN